MSFEQITAFLTAPANILWVVVVSGIVSSAISYFFRKRETRHRLATEYEYEQRKKLRNLIGSYHGRLVTAANNLNYRFWNLYENQQKKWLDVNGPYSPKHYYFHSSVHRFLNVCTLIRQFERESVFVDARIAEKRDFLFLKYLAALRWCMTDVALFNGLKYDNFDETDHFFADSFRHYCDSCSQPDGVFIEFDNFVTRVQKDRSLDPVLNFFNSLCRDEDRLRWDRLVAFHLILVAFINSFGYTEQQISKSQMIKIAEPGSQSACA